jgi:tRNA(fMet)-specific endonuclease VapC
VTYLIDTDWLVDAYIGRRGPVRVLEELRPQGIGVSIISHGELFEGTFGFSDTAERLTRVYSLLGQFETMPLSDPIIKIFGHTRSDLRRSGRLIPDLDVLIGATAVFHDLILQSRNAKHFARIPDPRLYQPA